MSLSCLLCLLHVRLQAKMTAEHSLRGTIQTYLADIQHQKSTERLLYSAKANSLHVVCSHVLHLEMTFIFVFDHRTLLARLHLYEYFNTCQFCNDQAERYVVDLNLFFFGKIMCETENKSN